MVWLSSPLNTHSVLTLVRAVLHAACLGEAWTGPLPTMVGGGGERGSSEAPHWQATGSVLCGCWQLLGVYCCSSGLTVPDDITRLPVRVTTGRDQCMGLRISGGLLSFCSFFFLFSFFVVFFLAAMIIASEICVASDQIICMHASYFNHLY